MLSSQEQKPHCQPCRSNDHSMWTLNDNWRIQLSCCAVLLKVTLMWSVRINIQIGFIIKHLSEINKNTNVRNQREGIFYQELYAPICKLRKYFNLVLLKHFDQSWTNFPMQIFFSKCLNVSSWWAECKPIVFNCTYSNDSLIKLPTTLNGILGMKMAGWLIFFF